MNPPQQQRAILNDTFIGLEIVIPTPKNWFTIIFLGIWLLMWTAGEVAAIYALVMGNLGDKIIFTLIWFLVWSAGGAFTIAGFLWNLRGQEIIVFEQGQLTRTLKGVPLLTPRIYSLSEAKNFTVKDNTYVRDDDGMTKRYKSIFWKPGVICFDYNGKVGRFGSSISVEEGKYILSKLVEKQLLKAENFANNRVPYFG